MEDIRIDSHKLMYHPERVAAWERGETVHPIYMEVSPSGACNHRCAFCAKDFVGYQANYLAPDRLAEFLQEMADAGLRSVMFAGEGEPCLHPDIARIALDARRAGLDISMTTNGSLLERSGICDIVEEFSWIRISMNAGDAETYAKVHGCKPDGFEETLRNLRALVEAKRTKGAQTTIGVQTIMLPENEANMVTHARTVRDIGADYFTVKPFTSHPKSENNQYADWQSTWVDESAAALERLDCEDFRVLFRAHAVDKIANRQREYTCCHALPFWAYLDSRGNLHACSTYLGDERFNYGNMNENSFADIWDGERRRALIEDLENAIDLDECRWGCRMDEVNRYLWELAHPGRHVNFI